MAITLAEPGGATMFVLGFARWLKQRDFDVNVLAGEGQWLFDQCKEYNISAIRVPSLLRAIRPQNDIRAYFELRRLFRDLKPDAIHLNSTKMGVLGSLAASSLRAYKPTSPPRIVYRIGGWVFLEPLSRLHKFLYRWIERATARFKDVIVCVHPDDKAAAERAGIKPRKEIVVVPNGIDLPAFLGKLKTRDEARRALGLGDGQTFTYGTVAHFYPAKDLPRYLEACAIVAKSVPEARFVLVGDGPERKAIERERERLGLNDRVILTGAVNDAQTLLRAFDAFVLPSAKEGMSWSLLEAMAAGLPCIATDVGANPWLLSGRAGWIAAKQSPEALSRAMIEAARDPQEAFARGAIAQQQIAERFPLEKTYHGNADALL